MLGTIFLSSVSAQEVLFISPNDPGSLNTSDQAMYSRLSGLGYNLTVKGSATNPASTSDANGKDLILISSTISSADITTKYRDVAVPVIVL
ncbi:MAG: hypothetical protein AAF399_03135, partial [Bacteroidota bacterium]